jgi:putative membrane-bound dehydrogenase-like protein
VFAAAPLAAQVPPEKAEATFTVHNPDLEFKLWASEPLFANPTCIDVDHLGRVWVCESVNYRTKLRGKPLNRAAGDRILILEDSKGTGQADRVTVFYQSPDLLAPLGIAVAKDPTGPGWKVYVCHSPDILMFEDKDGDGHADGPPKVLLHGFRGIDHDHGVHGISIGPDGKLYFSVGDQGVENLQSSDGKGRNWTTNHTDCQAGTIWRCDMDGTNLELIAHNFRNEYEPCVDSFGNIWTSDNDDDGNEQTRICYVMPGGNYGYWPRGPGESHWHEEQPGVVPKVLRTGFGSPTGMCVYEGNLLPEKYRGQLLHTDAGPRHVRCYHTKPKGAGYEIEREDIVTSTDTWFRPSDICVAPDGSVFVSDWYDPGVGGHGMGDTTRGRIYRLAPKGSKYAVPRLDLATDSGRVEAFKSPAQSVRYLASAGLNRVPTTSAVGSMVWKANEGPLLRARALWLTHLLVPTGEGRVLKMLDDPDPRLVCTALRVTSDFRTDAFNFLVWDNEQGKRTFRRLCMGPDGAVRREALLLLARVSPEDSGLRPAFLVLMKAYDGHDRFYLAAIGIAVGTDPTRREIILADFEKQFPDWNDKVADLVWELRPPSVMPKLGKRLADATIPPAQRALIVDILATSGEKDAGTTVLGLLSANVPAEVKDRAIENLRLFLPGKWKGLAKSVPFHAAVDRLLDDPKSRKVGLQLIAAADYGPALSRIAELADGGSLDAVRTLGRLHQVDAVTVLERVHRAGLAASRSPSLPRAGGFTLAIEAANSLGALASGSADGPVAKLALAALQRIVLATDEVDESRHDALAGLAGSQAGTLWLLQLKRDGKMPPEIVADVGRLLRNSPFQGLRNQAMIVFPPPRKLEIAKLPPIAELAKRHGDAERGKQVMHASLTGDAQCMKCHAVKGQGGNVGPDLATIGTKASRENLLESILYPSKAIADQYVQWNVTLARGMTISGLLVEDKPDHVTIRDANGKDIRIKREEIVDKEKGLKSLMPEDIAQALTEDELIDVVEYLMTLQSPAAEKR